MNKTGKKTRACTCVTVHTAGAGGREGKRWSFLSAFSNKQAPFTPFINTPSLMASLCPSQTLPQPLQSFLWEFHRPRGVLPTCPLRQNFSTAQRDPETGAPTARRAALLGLTPAVFLPLHSCALMRTWYNCPVFVFSSTFLLLEFTNNSFYSHETWCLSSSYGMYFLSD